MRTRTAKTTRWRARTSSSCSSRAALAAALLLLRPPRSRGGSLRRSRSGEAAATAATGKEEEPPPNPNPCADSDPPGLGGGASVRAYDGVVPSPSARRALVEFAELHSRIQDWKDDDSTSFFERGEESSPLESALDAVLTELGDDDSPYVEYWSRDEYVNVGAHADLDEGVEERLFPRYSHVLYLAVQPGLVAPTVVFPDRLGGWDGENLTHARSDERLNSGGGRVDMLSVPAVEGRLLRFDGRAMHGAPRPHDRWFAPEGGGEGEDDDSDDERNVPPGYDYEEWDSEDDEDDDDVPRRPVVLESFQRSVILFNSWSELPPNAALWREVKARIGMHGDKERYLRGTPVRTVVGEDEDPDPYAQERQAKSNDDDDSDEDDEVEDERREDPTLKGLSEAERRGRTLKEAYDILGILRGHDPRVLEAEERVLERWRGEFGPDLRGMGPARRGEWREAEFDCGGGGGSVGGNAAATANRRRLAEMEEAMDEVAGIPDASEGAMAASVASSAAATEQRGGEVLDVELTGTAYRRLHPFRTVRLRTPPADAGTGTGTMTSAREALTSPDRPTRAVLHQGRCR